MDNLPKITSAMLIVTHACNLACRYCFVNQKPQYMTYETAFDATEFLIKNSEEEGQVPSINFFGGEPMLMWDKIIVPLTNWIRNDYAKPFSLGMTTNGTLLNKERIKFMKDNGISILFSIDGAKETQDYNRPYHDGTGSFDSLKDIIQLLPNEFNSVTFRSTIIPETCEHTWDNIKFAIDSGYKSFFVTPNFFDVNGWTDEKKRILQSEMEKYKYYVIDEFRNNREPITFSLFDHCLKDIKMINWAIDKDEYRVNVRCLACGKCGLGSNKFASIHPDGSIYGCQEMTSSDVNSVFYIGNIYDGTDEDKRRNLMAQYDEKKMFGSNCKSCKLNRICEGGCIANNYLQYGDINHHQEVACWWKQLMLDIVIEVVQTLGQEENELFKRKWQGA